MPTEEIITKPIQSGLEKASSIHITRLTNWVTSVYADGQVKPSKLSKHLKGYWNTLAAKVSTMTSLAFPVDTIDFGKAYEPLDITTQSNRQTINSTAVVKQLGEGNQRMLVIDGGGMGKTTYAKHLVSKILFKTGKTPLFYELRRTSGNLKADLLAELSVNGKPFYEAVFNSMLEHGKLVLILDGFDEVHVDLQHDIAEQILQLSLEALDCSFVVTSRPQSGLPKLHNQQAYQLKGFSNSQAISFLQRYDNISGFDIGKNLSSELNAVPDEFIKSPLLLSLLYKTYGVNKSIAEKKSTFYDELYQALFKGHDSTNKNTYSREKKSQLDFENFRRFLQAFCFILTMKSIISFSNDNDAFQLIEKAVQGSLIAPASTENLLDDLLVAVPLMHRDGNDIKFSHKSIVDYFAAEYILRHGESRKLLDKISESNNVQRLEALLEFVSELSPLLYNEVIVEPIAKKISQIREPASMTPIQSAAIIGGMYIGILDTNNDLMISDINTEDTFQEKTPNHQKVPKQSTGYLWVECEIDSVLYLVVVTAPPFSTALLSEVVKKLSSEVGPIPKIDDSEKKASVEELLKILPLNEYIEITDTTVTKLSHLNYVQSIVMDASRMRYLEMTSKPNYYRAFDKNRSIEFLDKLQHEIATKVEFDELIM